MCYIPYITRACCGVFWDPGKLNLTVMELCQKARLGPLLQNADSERTSSPVFDPHWSKCNDREYKRFLLETRYPLPCQKCANSKSPRRHAKAARYARRLFQYYPAGRFKKFNMPTDRLLALGVITSDFHAYLPTIGMHLQRAMTPGRSRPRRRADKRKARRAFEGYMRTLGRLMRDGILWSEGVLVCPSKLVPGAPEARMAESTPSEGGSSDSDSNSDSNSESGDLPAGSESIVMIVAWVIFGIAFFLPLLGSWFTLFLKHVFERMGIRCERACPLLGFVADVLLPIPILLYLLKTLEIGSEK